MTKEVNTYIITKYRETKNINNDKILNTDKLFILKDSEGNILSHVIDFNIEDTNESQKFILIGTEEIFKNLKNNILINISWTALIRLSHLIL